MTSKRDGGTNAMAEDAARIVSAAASRFDSSMAADSLNPAFEADTLADFRLGSNPEKLEEYVTSQYEAHREEVFRYLRGRGVRPAEAREICQEAFLRLFTALTRGEKVRNARAWVFTVAHNCAVNTVLSERDIASTGEAETEIPAAVPDPEEALLRKENLTRVHSAIGALPQQQRQFIRLRTAGFRYSEIAEITGVTIGTVAQTLFRAINRLRKALHEE